MVLVEDSIVQQVCATEQAKEEEEEVISVLQMQSRSIPCCWELVDAGPTCDQHVYFGDVV